MDTIKHAEIKPKPPRTACGRIKSYLTKKAVLLSTIAALSGGCGGIPSANLPSGAEGNWQGQPLPAVYSSRFADERHMTIAMSLVGADRRAFRCDPSNEAKFKSVELWKERYEGAEINEGRCVTIEGVRRTYSVYLDEIRVSGGLYRDHSLLIADQNSRVQHVLLGRGKYLRLGNDASIYMLYDKSKDITYMLLHRQRKASDVGMKFENFTATDTPDACSEFIKNTKSMPDILERVTGVNIGDCYREIRFYYNPDYDVPGSMANMYNVGDLAFIQISPSYLVYDNKCARKYEVHELQHAMRYCANSSTNEEGGHNFSEATQAELMKEFGDALGINTVISPLSQWVNNITKDISPIMNLSPIVRCSALKRFFLSKRYLLLSDEGKRDLIREFHTAMISDPRMLAESTEMDAINDITCTLAKDPSCAATLKNNCPK